MSHTTFNTKRKKFCRKLFQFVWERNDEASNDGKGEKNERDRGDDDGENETKWQSRMRNKWNKRKSLFRSKRQRTKYTHKRTQPTWNETLQQKWWNIIITLLYSPPPRACVVGTCILFIFQFSYLHYFAVLRICLSVYLYSYSYAFTTGWLCKNNCSLFLFHFLYVLLITLALLYRAKAHTI